MNPRDWMKQEPPQYLPIFLRDFHDAKDFFKTLQAYYEFPEDLKGHNWVSNHIFTVDFFLWFCGVHGYTLQKSRKKGVEFEDMDATLRKAHEERHAGFAKMMQILTAPKGEAPATKEPEQSPTSQSPEAHP